jgi:hypothetical protein
MAWTDYLGGPGEIVPSPFDSARFGYTISRLTVGTRWRDTAHTADELAESLWLRVAQDPSDIMFIRYPSELIELPADGAALPEWTLLPAGNLVYWSYDARKAPQSVLPVGMELVVLEGGAEADPFLDALLDVFRAYPSHYAANPLFDGNLVAAGYREWAQTTLSEPSGRLYGLREGGAPIGVAITCSLHGGEEGVEIELAGIVGSAQGRGRYRHLLDAIARDARSAPRPTVVISTQSGNIRVQRAWARAGYRPMLSIDTVHAVRSMLLEGVLERRHAMPA